MKVAITTTSFGKYDRKPLDTLEENGFKTVLNPYGRKLKKEESIKLCENVIGIIAGTEVLDAEILEKLPDLKVISRCGTGLDNIDLDAAKKLRIKVFNTPNAPTLAVAEMTVGLILNLLRKINQMDASIRDGRWEKQMGNLLSGKKIGVVGFGRIGRKVAGMLSFFGCEIMFADPFVEDGTLGFKKLPLEELLSVADIVTLHVPSGDRLIGAREIGLMKKSAWLVNVSRGGVVDEEALYHALKEGHISGAALDVFEQEPYTGLLRELNNVILTPHIGSYAKESRIEMEMQAVENLLRGLEGIQ